MGAWGTDTFDNDTACDWAHGLEGVDDLSFVTLTLEACVVESNWLTISTACQALAACEVIARLKGWPGKQNTYTEPVDQWVHGHPQTPPVELCTLGAKKIDLIVAHPRSELAQVWEGDADWIAAVADLRRRVLA